MPSLPRWPILFCALLVLGLACTSLAAPRPKASKRALWITRFDFKTREDVVRAIDSAKQGGFDTVLFQVRGNATAFYRSKLEPWAAELGGKDPGFDPLEVAIEAARARKLELHAWVNVVPAWWGTDPPTDPAQVYNKRKEWLWYDQKGVQQALSDKFYVGLNPCLPEVRAYIADVCADIVLRYPIDGLHLDYLRFPNEAPAIPAGSGIDYPRDKKTLALFRAESGKTPEQDPKGWNAWRTARVTELLREIKSAVREARPELELSCAVGPDPERALHHFQDVRTWLAEGLLDVVYPMNYTRDPAVFDKRVAEWRKLAAGRRVVMGLRVEDDPAVVRAQTTAAVRGFQGYAMFAYSLLFDSPNTSTDQQTPAMRLERAERRKKIVPVIQASDSRADVGGDG
jgi:uncharacterized lipoprotein YddW (UPF0748 family)